MNLLSDTGFHPELLSNLKGLVGVIVQHHHSSDLEQTRKRCPHVVVTSNRDPLPDFFQVINDDKAIGSMAAQYLLGLNLRRFIFAGQAGLLFSHHRAQGFREALWERGHSVEEWSLQTQIEIPGLLESAMQNNEPIGMMATTDLHARWLTERSSNPREIFPQRIALIGVDDDHLQSSISPVPLSSVVPSGSRIGYEACRLITRMLRGEQDIPRQTIIAPDRIAVRESSDMSLVSDPLVQRAIRWIQEKHGELHDVADLAARLKVSRRTLETRFRTATDNSPAQALTNARIDRARHLLATTDLSIKEISFLLGFSEPRMLTLVFKRQTRELPTEYRSRIRPGKIG